MRNLSENSLVDKLRMTRTLSASRYSDEMSRLDCAIGSLTFIAVMLFALFYGLLTP